jgi:Type II CAAX prenyl endopeptidase Rce1-like
LDNRNRGKNLLFKPQSESLTPQNGEPSGRASEQRSGIVTFPLFDRHRCARGGDVSSRRRSRCFSSRADQFGEGICLRRDWQNAAGRSCVGIDPVARREIGRYRAEAACELDAYLRHRYWVCCYCFHVIYLSEKAGFRRDLSKFKDVQGNLELAALGVFYASIGAGFYEEFMFRGFLMQGLAMFFGASRGAWIAACVVQGVLFGAAHAYQNPLGIAITGTLGVLMGLLVLASGRNLWPVIIGHGLFDASRFVLFYFGGPPTG